MSISYRYRRYFGGKYRDGIDFRKIYISTALPEAPLTEIDCITYISVAPPSREEAEVAGIFRAD